MPEAHWGAYEPFYIPINLQFPTPSHFLSSFNFTYINFVNFLSNFPLCDDEIYIVMYVCSGQTTPHTFKTRCISHMCVAVCMQSCTSASHVC